MGGYAASFFGVRNGESPARVLRTVGYFGRRPSGAAVFTKSKSFTIVYLYAILMYINLKGDAGMSEYQAIKMDMEEYALWVEFNLHALESEELRKFGVNVSDASLCNFELVNIPTGRRVGGTH